MGYRLALLLSQACGSDIVKYMILEQIADWKNHKSDHFIEEDRLKIYSLISGNMVWSSSVKNINVCEDMDWKRCLALHFWYACNPTCSIAEVLNLYKSAF